MPGIISTLRQNRLKLPALAVFPLLLCLVAGCAPKQTIVVDSAPKTTIILVPDPNGQIGKADVRTTGGTSLLEKPGDMITVKGVSEVAPSVTEADQKFIAATFADVLAVEPLPSEKFILYFETGTTKLTTKSRQALEEVIAAIKRRQAITIRVSGHTDTVGSDEYNNKLARDRSTFVERLLLQIGVPADQMSVSSHGKGNPLIPTPDGIAEPRNRRVEIILR